MATDSATERRGPRETSGRWLVLALASAGWVFDVYEGQLFAIFKTPMLAELAPGNIDRPANLALAAFLIGGAAGGLFFGVLADRYGRARVMSATIVVYSAFSALTALVSSVWQIHVLRFLVAMGTGGEWAIAAALVAESFPSRTRATASGVFHASSVLGVALASLTGVVFARPEHWRWAFVVGLAPALLVVWVRLGLREPAAWRARDVAPRNSTELSELFGPGPWRARAWIGLGMAAVGLGSYWGIFAWAPELVRATMGGSADEPARQSAASLAYLLMNFTGGLLGLLSFAPLANRYGRRPAFAVYHLGALIFAPLTFLFARTYVHALCLLPVMAFFVLGMHAGYAIYFPELFPARLRATGASVCFNIGRILGAVVLLVRGALGAWYGLRWAVVIISSVFLVGLVLIAFAPETRGTELPD